MVDLNLRGIDPSLKAKLKVSAFNAGQTMRGYCVAILEESVGTSNVDHAAAGSEQSGQISGAGDAGPLPVLPKKQGRAKRLHPVQSMRSELAGRRGHNERPEVSTLPGDGSGQVEGIESCRSLAHRLINSGGKLVCLTCKVPK